MDNITPVPGTNSSCITLSPFHSALYQQSSLKIQSHDGQHLETIGHDIQKESHRDNATRLFHQVSLVQSLTSQIDQHMELPPRAVYGLSDLLYQVEEFYESHIK